MDEFTEADRTRLYNLEHQQRELTRCVEKNTQAIADLTENTKALVDAWKASGTVLSIVTAASKFLIAVGVIWGFFVLVVKQLYNGGQSG